MTHTRAPAPERTPLSYASSDDPPIKRGVIRMLEVLSGRRHIDQLYWKVLEDAETDAALFAQSIEQLQVKIDYDGTKLSAVPKEEPVVFIANHPFGVLDGLVLCYLVQKVRPRFRILVNNALCVTDRTADYLLPIDFDETKDAMRRNIETKREALACLDDGEALVIFPSGGVATAKKPFGPAEDLEWKTFLAKVVRSSRATVVPLFFHGQNSRKFHIISRVSQTVRLAVLMHELKRRIGTTVKVTIGDPIPFASLENVRGRTELTEHLKQVTHALGRPSEAQQDHE